MPNHSALNKLDEQPKLNTRHLRLAAKANRTLHRAYAIARNADLIATRNAAIRAAHADGHGIHAISRAIHLSPPQVSRIVNNKPR